VEVRILCKITAHLSRPQFHLSLLGSLALSWTYRHLAAKVGMSKGGGKEWQTNYKNLPRMQCTRAILVTWLGSGSCQPGLQGWILMNEWMNECITILSHSVSEWYLFSWSTFTCLQFVSFLIGPDLVTIRHSRSMTVGCILYAFLYNCPFLFLYLKHRRNVILFHLFPWHLICGNMFLK